MKTITFLVNTLRLSLTILMLVCSGFANDEDVEIYIFNVGQGNAALVVGPGEDRITCLIDSGRGDENGDQILDQLYDLGEELDYTIVTHFDIDHCQQMGRIFRVLGPPLNAAYDRGGDRRASGSSEQPDFFLDYVSNAEPKREVLQAEQIISLGGGAYIQCLAIGDPDFMPNETTSTGNIIDGDPFDLKTEQFPMVNENEKSSALLIKSGRFEMMINGDQGQAAEFEVAQKISQSPLWMSLDILQVAHHGSGENTHEGTAALTKPEVAIISVGDSVQYGPNFSQYGHPKQLTLNKLKDAEVGTLIQTEMGGSHWIGNGTPDPGDAPHPRDYSDFIFYAAYNTIRIYVTPHDDYTIRFPGITGYYRTDGYEIPITTVPYRNSLPECGARCIQMIGKTIDSRWNNSATDIFKEYHAGPSNCDLTPEEIIHALSDIDEGVFGQNTCNFRHFSTPHQSEAINFMCWWADYTAPKYGKNIPALLSFDGDFNHWKVVIGIVCSEKPIREYTGGWYPAVTIQDVVTIHDPEACGEGNDKVMSAHEFLQRYEPGPDGKYHVICNTRRVKKRWKK